MLTDLRLTKSILRLPAVEGWHALPIDCGSVTSIKDRNGNQVTFSSGQITDSLNRVVTIAYANMPSTAYDQIRFAGQDNSGLVQPK